MIQGKNETRSERRGIDLPPESRLWYVVHTKPGHEHRVVSNLSDHEIETLLPLFAAFQFLRGKAVRKIKPLFPNYLFARFDLELHYYRVKWARGVNRILGTSDEPVPISEKVIEGIKERIGRDHLVTMGEEFEKGNPVQVVSGPLKDLTGVFDRTISDRGRVRILLSLIGIDVPVQISRWQIKKVA